MRVSGGYSEHQFMQGVYHRREAGARDGWLSALVFSCSPWVTRPAVATAPGGPDGREVHRRGPAWAGRM